MQQLVAEISLKAISANAEALRKRAGKPLIAVVKDDAYGHGAEAVALSLGGSVAVSTVWEGAALRTAGFTGEILVFTPPLCKEEALALSAYDLTASVTSFSAMKILLSAGTPRVHIALNTGMNRYGFPPCAVRRAVRLSEREGLRVEGVYSHFYEPASASAAREQSALFARGAEEVRTCFPHAVRHLAASGGIRCGRGTEFDAVRAGLSLYGYSPFGGGGRRAMKLYAYVSHRCTQTGGGVGYASVEEYYGKLHTLRLGYGDGFFREGMEGAVGKLCMDAAVCKGDLPLGRKVPVVTDFAHYARLHGTTVYEALVRLSARAVKEYR